jgi:hypothetical protein
MNFLTSSATNRFSSALLQGVNYIGTYKVLHIYFILFLPLLSFPLIHSSQILLKAFSCIKESTAFQIK